MLGLIFMAVGGIILVNDGIKKSFQSYEDRKEARERGWDCYLDGFNEERLVSNNHLGGQFTKFYNCDEEVQKFKDEFDFRQELDRVLRDVDLGKEIKNYTRERRLKKLQKAKQNRGKNSIVEYPLDRNSYHNNDLCVGYRYVDLDSYDIYVIRGGKYGKYFLRMKDGKFIRPIDKKESPLDCSHWVRAEATEEQRSEINELNIEQERIKKKYRGMEMLNKLYRNDDTSNSRIKINLW